MILKARQQMDYDKQKEFLDAARLGHRRKLHKMIDQGVNLEAAERRSMMTALHYATQQGHLDCMKLLIESGHTVDPRNRAGETPLFLACQSSRGISVLSDNRSKIDRIIQLLVKHGADINAIDNAGYTALARAIEDHYPVIDTLVDLKANLEHSLSDGCGMFELADKAGNQQALSYFKPKGDHKFGIDCVNTINDCHALSMVM